MRKNNNNILERFTNLLGLEDNTVFTDCIEQLRDRSVSADEKVEARREILRTILTAAEYAVSEDSLNIEGIEQLIDDLDNANNPQVEETLRKSAIFYSELQKFETQISTQIQIESLDRMAISIENTANEFGSTSALVEIAQITSETSLPMKKEIIKSALEVLTEDLESKFTNKKAYKKVKKAMKKVNKSVQYIGEALETDMEVSYQKLADGIDKLLEFETETLEKYKKKDKKKSKAKKKEKEGFFKKALHFFRKPKKKGKHFIEKPKKEKKYSKLRRRILAGIGAISIAAGGFLAGRFSAQGNNDSKPQKPITSDIDLESSILAGYVDIPGTDLEVELPGIEDPSEPIVDTDVEEPKVETPSISVPEAQPEQTPQATPTPEPEYTPTPTPEPTPEPTPTPTPTPESTPESTPETIDPVEAAIQDDAKIVYDNWSKIPSIDGSTYDKETIVELIKCIRGLDSTMTIDQADGILVERLNSAIVPGVNNTLVGEPVEETHELDFATLIGENQAGIKAVENMENYLNGCLTDMDSIQENAVNAYTDQVKVLGSQETVEGLNATTETDPGVRLVWSRLAIGANAVIGPEGEGIIIEANDVPYTATEITDATALETVATEAKKDMGYTADTITMN